MKEQFPESQKHGACWSAFTLQTNPRAEGALDKWLWFLAGWKAKCQQNSLNGPRRGRSRYT